MVEIDRKEHLAGRVIVVGLDGGTWSVLDPLLEDGHMPALKALRDGGCWGTLKSTIPPLTAPAWASLITGKNPGKHGIYQFAPIDRSLYQGNVTRIVNSQTVQGATLWNILGAAGKRVGVMNVPLTYPPSKVNGVMVTGMLTPRQSEHFTYPPELSSRLKDYTIDVSMGESKYGVLSDLDTADHQSLKRLIEELKNLATGRTDKALEFLNEYSPDFFILLFTETERMSSISSVISTRSWAG
jgi:predicted AlkP superfamily phosphohydrolase/phosphomutase